MRAFTEAQIRDGFVNASRREAREAVLPDLDALDWERLDVLGWVDPKRPGMAYAVFDVDGEATCVLLRPVPRPPERRRMLCSWCQDVTATDDVLMVTAKRAGEAGRRGDTVGTSVCGDFGCSRRVRRRPTVEEVGHQRDAAAKEAAARDFIDRRVASLRERSAHFLQTVLTGE